MNKIAVLLAALMLSIFARDAGAQARGDQSARAAQPNGRAGRGNFPPLEAGPLPYTLVDNWTKLPPDIKLGNVSAIAVNSKGHVFVFHRGPVPLFEFDADGTFVRGFGEGLATRAHGIKIDSLDNIWITDNGNHTVVKMDPAGKVVMTLGERGKNGTWDEAAGTKLFDQPTDVAFAANGDFFVSQGHGGTPMILRFDRTGRLLKSWTVEPRGADVATNLHMLVFNRQGLLLVADREAGRVLVFDVDGNLRRTIQMRNRVSGLALGRDGRMYVSSSVEGQIIQADLDGNVLTVAGTYGTGPGQFIEAHSLALGPNDEIYAADNGGSRVQNYIPRK